MAASARSPRCSSDHNAGLCPMGGQQSVPGSCQVYWHASITFAVWIDPPSASMVGFWQRIGGRRPGTGLQSGSCSSIVAAAVIVLPWFTWWVTVGGQLRQPSQWICRSVRPSCTSVHTWCEKSPLVARTELEPWQWIGGRRPGTGLQSGSSCTPVRPWCEKSPSVTRTVGSWQWIGGRRPGRFHNRDPPTPSQLLQPDQRLPLSWEPRRESSLHNPRCSSDHSAGSVRWEASNPFPEAAKRICRARWSWVWRWVAFVLPPREWAPEVAIRTGMFALQLRASCWPLF